MWGGREEVVGGQRKLAEDAGWARKLLEVRESLEVRGSLAGRGSWSGQRKLARSGSGLAVAEVAEAIRRWRRSEEGRGRRGSWRGPVGSCLSAEEVGGSGSCLSAVGSWRSEEVGGGRGSCLRPARRLFEVRGNGWRKLARSWKFARPQDAGEGRAEGRGSPRVGKSMRSGGRGEGQRKLAALEVGRGRRSCLVVEEVAGGRHEVVGGRMKLLEAVGSCESQKWTEVVKWPGGRGSRRGPRMWARSRKWAATVRRREEGRGQNVVAGRWKLAEAIEVVGGPHGLLRSEKAGCQRKLVEYCSCWRSEKVGWSRKLLERQEVGEARGSWRRTRKLSRPHAEEVVGGQRKMAESQREVGENLMKMSEARGSGRRAEEVGGGQRKLPEGRRSARRPVGSREAVESCGRPKKLPGGHEVALRSYEVVRGPGKCGSPRKLGGRGSFSELAEVEEVGVGRGKSMRSEGRCLRKWAEYYRKWAGQKLPEVGRCLRKLAQVRGSCLRSKKGRGQEVVGGHRKLARAEEVIKAVRKLARSEEVDGK
ncbi:hypothetical protein FNV43_RR21395 [Rhamnella rubrinervis]|uniref:Uncharacterized protein n=1 Tax=Rhamnella rubrinervis TaxID=2594499 RepID=A0A8K0DW51_9ROSA|nr:hypothetical protein FNV43_RR21395 [Rhamnella rubrinervis]